LTLSADELRLRADLRLPAAIQLTINETLRTAKCAARLRDDQGFAQLAIDALYYIGRCWENGSAHIDLSSQALQTYLTERIRDRSRGNATANSSASKISASDLTAAHELVQRQITLLTSFKDLIECLRSRPAYEDWRLNEIIPVELNTTGLLCANTDDPHVTFQYRFLLNETGAPISETPPQTWLDQTMVSGITEQLATIRAFGDMLRYLQLDVDLLVRLGLLPKTLTERLLSDAENALALAEASQLNTETLQNAMTTARQLSHALTAAAPLLPNFLRVGVHIRRRADDRADTLRNVLFFLVSYLPALRPIGPDTSRLATAVLNELVSPPLTVDLGTAAGIEELHHALMRIEHDIMAPVRLGLAERERLWLGWRERVLALVEQGRPTSADYSIEDLVSTALDSEPGSLFHSDLTLLGAAGWSRVALAGLRRSNEPPAPAWTVFAGLSLLGFSGGLLKRFFEQLPKDMQARTSPSENDAITRIIQRTPERSAGILVIMDRAKQPINFSDYDATRPLFVVDATNFEAYEEGLNHLASQGAFEGIVDVQ
jgi:hypothetical protein